MAEGQFGVACLNADGRTLVVVGPFDSYQEAISFGRETVHTAYHGYTVAPLMTADEYSGDQ